MYLARKNIGFKALLLLDNAPGHAAGTIRLEHPHIKVAFLQPRTTSILQPMDMGVIKTFKSYYTRHVYRRALTAMDNSADLTLLDFWRSYNIRDCLEVIKEAWNDVKESTLNACWYALRPEVINNFTGSPHLIRRSVILSSWPVGLVVKASLT